MIWIQKAVKENMLIAVILVAIRKDFN